MKPEPITHLEKSIAGIVAPVTHLEKVIEQYGGGGGGGAVSSVNGKTGAVVLSASDVGASTAETVVEVSGTTPTITPAANTIYKCRELTSLTISNPPASGAYSIVFTSGATATQTTFPASILGLENFSAEANALYEINVLDHRAVVGKWMEPVTIVPWSTGTDEQIAAMVAALDVGKITIADTGWQIGDERTVSLAAMEATGVGETHAAQQVTLVLMDSQHYDLVGGGKDHFVVGLKNCLNEMGYMNSKDTSADSWEASARRTWCNNVFKNAIPETLRNCFKQFNVITCTEWTGTTNTTSNDYFALFAEKEVFGKKTWSNEAEAAALTQIEYYATEANRIKTVNGGACLWWERSPSTDPRGEGRDFFCLVTRGGGSGNGRASDAIGLAPFGCI